MADCKIESVVVVVEVEDRYILTLTKQEAEYLYRLLGHHVYGFDSKDELRITSSRILLALERHFDYDLGPLPCAKGKDQVYLYDGDDE